MMGAVRYQTGRRAIYRVAPTPEETYMPRQNIQPEALSKRVVQGHVLYSHIVVVEGRRTIFIAGQLARDRDGNVVGKGDMRAQIRQVGENLKAALAAAGATLNDLVKTTTYVTDIDESACARPARRPRGARGRQNSWEVASSGAGWATG
jgi:enamine deaminase RidA (YjgF/YER057c/UK114 family)